MKFPVRELSVFLCLTTTAFADPISLTGTVVRDALQSLAQSAPPNLMVPIPVPEPASPGLLAIHLLVLAILIAALWNKRALMRR